MNDLTFAGQAESRQRFYYLHNFEFALQWLADRYDDLWIDDERAFLIAFPTLPLASRALLVRMLMRTGPLFRVSALGYDEIGSPTDAVSPLNALGWVDPDPALTIDEIFRLHTVRELANIFPDAFGTTKLRKSELLETLRSRLQTACTYLHWWPGSDDQVVRVNVASLCDRLRLMFFGNLRQTWSEFVVSDLGIIRYQHVPIQPSSRAFQSRKDIESFLTIHACREYLETCDAIDSTEHAASLEAMIQVIEALPCGQGWIDARQQKLLFRIGQHFERRRNWNAALACYGNCRFPGSRHRRMRVLELFGRHQEAHDLALQAQADPESEEEAQRAGRMLPRLRRELGLSVKVMRRPDPVKRIDLILPRPAEPTPVEMIVCNALSEPGTTVHYVENALINSLFGLLCWDAIFAPLPGAFFHPFQRGPADLHSPGFYATRREEFTRCLERLDNGGYVNAIRQTFQTKTGVASPFVHWRLLTNEVLEAALRCIPAAHLKKWFVRLAQDVRLNRTGFPDLIRFWPAEGRYEMIEVKGPGDRLQDNQIRWLAYCVEHGMPVRVVHVQWSQESFELMTQS